MKKVSKVFLTSAMTLTLLGSVPIYNFSEVLAAESGAGQVVDNPKIVEYIEKGVEIIHLDQALAQQLHGNSSSNNLQNVYVSPSYVAFYKDWNFSGWKRVPGLPTLQMNRSVSMYGQKTLRLSGTSESIESLEGMQYFVNVEKITFYTNLHNSKGEPLDMKYINMMPSLKEIVYHTASGSRDEAILTQLKDKELEHLTLVFSTPIQNGDLDFLREFTNVKKLTIIGQSELGLYHDNQYQMRSAYLTDMDFLEGMTSLEKVSFSTTAVRDTSQFDKYDFPVYLQDTWSVIEEPINVSDYIQEDGSAAIPLNKVYTTMGNGLTILDFEDPSFPGITIENGFITITKDVVNKYKNDKNDKRITLNFKERIKDITNFKTGIPNDEELGSISPIDGSLIDSLNYGYINFFLDFTNNVELPKLESVPVLQAKPYVSTGLEATDMDYMKVFEASAFDELDGSITESIVVDSSEVNLYEKGIYPVMFRVANSLGVEVEVQSTLEIVDPLVKDPVIEEPVVKEPVIEEPVVKEPVIEEPVVKEPVIEEPVVKEPVIEEPVVKEPIIKEPVIKEPVIKEPVVKEPVIEEPVVKEPVVKEPVVKEPVVKEPVVKEPVVKEPELVKDLTTPTDLQETGLESSNVLTALGSLMTFTGLYGLRLGKKKED